MSEIQVSQTDVQVRSKSEQPLELKGLEKLRNRYREEKRKGVEVSFTTTSEMLQIHREEQEIAIFRKPGSDAGRLHSLARLKPREVELSGKLDAIIDKAIETDRKLMRGVIREAYDLDRKNPDLPPRGCMLALFVQSGQMLKRVTYEPLIANLSEGVSFMSARRQNESVAEGIKNFASGLPHNIRADVACVLIDRLKEREEASS